MKKAFKISFKIIILFTVGLLLTLGVFYFKLNFEKNKACPPFPKNKNLYSLNEKLLFSGDEESGDGLKDTIYSYIKNNKLIIHQINSSSSCNYNQYGIKVTDDTLFLLEKACGECCTELTQYEITYKVNIKLKNKKIKQSYY
ncbi:MAG: hypothetical protein IPO64_06030 [Bacteroidetes bacterium]|nr:hypothetical protein [Bacteroidota bacterium]